LLIQHQQSYQPPLPWPINSRVSGAYHSCCCVHFESVLHIGTISLSLSWSAFLLVYKISHQILIASILNFLLAGGSLITSASSTAAYLHNVAFSHNVILALSLNKFGVHATYPDLVVPLTNAWLERVTQDILTENFLRAHQQM